jgi:cell division protein FtsA
MPLPPLVALEIGTTKVRAMVAEARDDDHLMILGMGECASRGVRKGEIVDFDTALSCVRTALHAAEENSNVSIAQVFVPVSGGHIQGCVNRGSVPVAGAGREISVDDVDYVMEAARAVNLPPDREILHTICQQFYLDDQQGVINPIGMEGSRLSLDMLILFGVRARLRNLVRIARSVPVDVQDVAFGGLCAALAVLTPHEKDNGVLVIDLGGGTTDYVAYAGSCIADAGSLAVGGDHVTNDIARGLRIALGQAEQLKENSGRAIIDLASRGHRIELPADSGPQGRVVRMGDLHIIASLRMEEILSQVKAEVLRNDLLHRFGSGVVLTGGGAYMKDVAPLAEKVFGLPCQVGRPKDVSGLAMATEGPEYATPIGMLRYAVRTARREAAGPSIRSLIKNFFTR